MSGDLRFDDVRHDCQPPKVDGPSYGRRHQVLARWKCSTCRQQWRYAAQFMDCDRFSWERVGFPSWRWRRVERRRLLAAQADHIGSDGGSDG